MSLLTVVERAHSPASHTKLPAYRHDVAQLSIDVTVSQSVDHIVAIDVGGTLAKVVFASDNEEKKGEVVLHFAKFDSDDVDAWLHFIHNKIQQLQNAELKMTGGGAVKYADVIKSKLGNNVKITHVDEMKSLANGISFLGQLPGEIFSFNTTSNTIEDVPQMSLDVSKDGECIFPGLVANIGSGVSFVACTSSSDFKRVGGTPLGGGSYAGLCHMLAECKTFEETITANEEISNNSNNTTDSNNIDLLVGDIYGTGYGAVGLPSAATASSFGKAGLHLGDKQIEKKQASKNEIVNSVALMTCWNIGQQGALWAQHVGAKHVLFGGYLARNQTNLMKYLALSVGRVAGIKPLFMVHAGFLGVLGAFFA